VTESVATSCPQCGSVVAPSLLSCPTCHALIHGARLRTLATQGAEAERRGEASAALEAWRTALTLLPRESQQFATIAARIERVAEPADRAPAAPAAGRSRGWAGGAAIGAALLAWKSKALVLFLLTKGKLLLLGLTKSSTLFSMLASLGVYWTAFGWRFAAGLVGSIYVHEMGHVAALRRLGIPASAPMFIPGFGALIRLEQHPASPRESARVGLAGPIWGLGAALAAFAIGAAIDAPIWSAIGHTGAWLNLFNLMPVWHLDGGRAFSAMSRVERAIACAALVLMFAVTREGLLVLLMILAGVQVLRANTDAAGDRTSLVHYVGLVIVLSLLCTVRAAV
jgi:Zn-dependent protease